MVHQTIYLPPNLRDWSRDKETRESFVNYIAEAKVKTAKKWNRSDQAKDANEATHPLGLWWHTIEGALQEVYGMELSHQG